MAKLSVRRSSPSKGAGGDYGKQRSCVTGKPERSLSRGPLPANRPHAYLIILCLLFMLGCKPRSPKHSSHSRKDATQLETGSLPIAALTPGDVLEVDKKDICTPGYSKRVREVPGAIKRKVYREYGRTKKQDICCEVDHLIPLELGGSNRESNLWPEPFDIRWNARVKDRLEGRLHGMVCDGSIELVQAQKEIAVDWISAYQRYVGDPDSAPKRRRE